MELEDDITTWNPMKDDFESEANTYENVMKPDEQIDKEYKLFVSGIPLKITKRGILNLFFNEGRISEDLALWKNKDASCQLAIVKALSYYDAIKIIEQYDGFYIGHYRMSIKFSSNEFRQNNEQNFSVNTKNCVKIQEKDNETVSKSRGRGLAMLEAMINIRQGDKNNEILPNITCQDTFDGNVISEATKYSTKDSCEIKADMKTSEIVVDASKPKKELNISGNCISCKKPGSKRCSKCKSIYCSKLCQIQNWEIHKNICLRPNLIYQNNYDIMSSLPESLIQKINENFITDEFESKFWKEMRTNLTLADLKFSCIETGQQFQAAISSEILTPKQIFLVPIELDTQLEEFTKNMTNYYQNEVNDEFQSIGIGDVCACEFAEDKNWYRAILISMQDHYGEVRFLDYGNVANIPWNKVVHLGAEFIDTPVFALECQIYNTKPVNNELVWSEEAQKYLADLLPYLTICKVTSYGTDTNNNVTYASIYNEEKEVNIGEILIARGLAMKCTNKELIEWNSMADKQDYLSKYGIHPDSDVCITYINDPNDFYFIDFNPQQKMNFKKLHEKLESISVEENIIPVVGDTIIAFYENKLYRAYVQDICDDSKIKVKFLDFGNVTHITGSDIKGLLNDGPLDIDQLAGFARNACLSDCRGAIKYWWNEEQSAYFKSNCELSVFKVGKLSIFNSKYRVQLIYENEESLFDILKSKS